MSFILLPTVMEFAGALSAVVFSGIGGEGVDSGGGDHLLLSCSATREATPMYHVYR